ncbi:MAG: hypothetical protein U0L65_02640 [Bacteroidales bacterium]|nr:hypothetical protein [Bacteroidales bacterium]
MSKLKEIFDGEFLRTHNILPQRIKPIDCRVVNTIKFDLIDGEEFVVEHQKGTGSFENKEGHNIEVLAYNKLMTQYNNYQSFSGVSVCDFVLYCKDYSIIVFNEHTSSISGIENLNQIDKKTGISKFEKVEKQLSDSISKFYQVQKIKDCLEECASKICLCSYKLYSGDNNTIKAFNRATEVIAKETGENGVELNSHKVEKFGFKYIRISHNYTFDMSR